MSTKVHLVKSMVFPVVMYGWESWTIKKAECWRTDAFQLWCWKRVLRIPWPARKASQPILKERSPEYSLQGLMQTEIPIFWPSDVKNWLLGKDPDAGKDWRQEEKGKTEDWDGWMVSLALWTCLIKLQELVMDREACHAAVHRITKSWTWLSNWTELGWERGLTVKQYEGSCSGWWKSSKIRYSDDCTT